MMEQIFAAEPLSEGERWRHVHASRRGNDRAIFVASATRCGYTPYLAHAKACLCKLYTRPPCDLRLSREVLVYGGTRDSEDARRFRDGAACLSNGLLDTLLCQRCGRSTTRDRAQSVVVHMLGAKHRNTFGVDENALDDGVELPNVSGPVGLLEEQK